MYNQRINVNSRRTLPISAIAYFSTSPSLSPSLFFLRVISACTHCPIRQSIEPFSAAKTTEMCIFFFRPTQVSPFSRYCYYCYGWAFLDVPWPFFYHFGSAKMSVDGAAGPLFVELFKCTIQRQPDDGRPTKKTAKRSAMFLAICRLIYFRHSFLVRPFAGSSEDGATSERGEVIRRPRNGRPKRENQNNLSKCNLRANLQFTMIILLIFVSVASFAARAPSATLSICIKVSTIRMCR